MVLRKLSSFTFILLTLGSVHQIVFCFDNQLFTYYELFYHCATYRKCAPFYPLYLTYVMHCCIAHKYTYFTVQRLFDYYSRTKVLVIIA